MLSLLSRRSPLSLRAFLTVMSAIAGVFFASAFSFAHAAAPMAIQHRQATGNASPVAARDAGDNKVKVQAGETLSGIAGGICGTPDDWTGFYNANRAIVRDPDVIFPGQMLQISCTDPGYTPPAPPPVQHPVTAARSDEGEKAQTPPSTPASTGTSVNAALAPVAYSGGGSFQSCVIARESGGNSQVMNASGHYGLYQFSYGTWTAHGGNGADFGHASVAEQNQVFANTVAADGHSDWSPYDGC